MDICLSGSPLPSTIYMAVLCSDHADVVTTALQETLNSGRNVSPVLVIFAVAPRPQQTTLAMWALNFYMCLKILYNEYIVSYSVLIDMLHFYPFICWWRLRLMLILITEVGALTNPRTHLFLSHADLIPFAQISRSVVTGSYDRGDFSSGGPPTPLSVTAVLTHVL